MIIRSGKDMQIWSGKEVDKGRISSSFCGIVQAGETVKEAINRLVIAHYGKMPKNTYWAEKYRRLGPHDNPTCYLPALWVDHVSHSQIFFVGTRWDNEKLEWVIF